MDAGRYFEGVTGGDVIRNWPGRTIRDYEDTRLALRTMNTSPLHFAEHLAGQARHGRCLINGIPGFCRCCGHEPA